MNLDNDILYKYLDSISKEGRFDIVNNNHEDQEIEYLFNQGLVDGHKADYQQNEHFEVEKMTDLKLTQAGQAMLEKLENKW
ncbi:hypothetical protein ERX40_04345 [Macrococcus carouselicus]|uniref:Uncharacterized protein n=2 Tax=Macrococcus carouselicus TaxID=69969 RepID=A0A9Q8CPE2_9STAP|nr:hypothetical protein ERX40_04345 [Macrococcus carouselicus]